jgi:quercetin dioxygenase-like cupin family protein
MSIIVMRDRDKEWLEPPAEWDGKAKPGEPTVHYKSLMAVAPGRPNMQRTRYEPRHFEPPHSHPEDEVIYMLSGNLAFGNQELSFGDALFIPKNTRYSLRAGDAGAEFVRVGLPVGA